MNSPLFQGRSVLSALAVVVCIAQVFAAENAMTVRLADEPITLPEFQFGAVPRVEHGLVGVSYGVVGASLILPYSKTWQFQLRTNDSLRGGDESYAITLAVWEPTSGTERDYLEVILSRLQSSDHRVRGVSFVGAGSEIVLRYQSQPRDLPEEAKALDPWWWHYWSAERLENAWADVHLTVVEPLEELPVDDDKITTFLGKGLRELPPKGQVSN